MTNETALEAADRVIETATREEFMAWLRATPDRVFVGWDGEWCRFCPIALFLQNRTGNPAVSFNGSVACIRCDSPAWMFDYGDAESEWMRKVADVADQYGSAAKRTAQQLHDELIARGWPA